MFSTKQIFIGLLLTIFVQSQEISKRGIYEFGYAPSFANSDFPFASLPVLPAPSSLIAKPILIQKIQYPAHVSPSEIAAAVSAAKEASASVWAAQERVQGAKQDLLEHQRISAQKDADATNALQRAEAAAAVQRQASKAAANAVVMAQQRLAQAKSEVAEQQAIAAAKEAQAAAALHKSASVAAEEIQRTEATAAKIAALQKSQTSAALKYVTAAKDASLSAASAAVAAASTHPEDFASGPWVPPGKIIHYAPWG